MAAERTRRSSLGGDLMAKFIMLMKYTDEGVRHFKGFRGRLDHARKGAAELGVTIDAFYLTMREYDAVVAIDAPHDRTATQLDLIKPANGRARIVTTAAFTE